MSVIVLFCDAFVLWIIFNVVVKHLCDDLGKDPWSWTHVSSTLTRELVWPIPPTLIWLFNVVRLGGPCHKPHALPLLAWLAKAIEWALVNWWCKSTMSPGRALIHVFNNPSATEGYLSWGYLSKKLELFTPYQYIKI